MFARLFRSADPRENYDSTWGYWPGEVTPTSWSGQQVSARTSLQLLTVYGCVRLICDSIATLPVDTFRELPDGSRQPISAPTWLTSPTVDLDFTAWCTQVLTSLLLSGNAYIAVLRTADGRIVELPTIDPERVTVTRRSSLKQYLVNGKPYSGEIVHIPGLMMPGADVGVSPVEAARQSVGLGLSALQFGANFFSGGDGNMPGVIESPKVIVPDVKKELARQWQAKRAKGGRGLPGVLDDGATWKATGVTNEQAQFLEARQFTAAEVAGQMFLVDPSDLGIPVAGTSLTYANLQERNTRRVQVTFLPWMVRVERAISALMANPRFMKFNVDGLLRGDASQRWDQYGKAMMINTQAAAIGMDPVLATSEMRDFENLGPAPEQTTPPMEVPA